MTQNPTPSKGDILLGLFTATTEKDHRLLGAQTISYKGLSKVGRQCGVKVIVFKPEDLESESAQIRGFMYDVTRRRWCRVATHLPDVVYNRVPRRSLEQRDDVQRALNALHKAGVPVFNPGFLDKWTTYRTLALDAKIRHHLPEFQRVHSVDDVDEMLSRWKAVFLKPINGSLGHGIIFVQRFPFFHRYHASVNGCYRKGHRGLWSELRPVLIHYMGTRKYLGQAAVRRPMVGGAPFDLRVLVQKDSDGQWQVSGMAARIAARGRVLTHVPRGGSQISIDRVISLAFKGRLSSEAILQQVADISRRAAGVIETYRAGTYGELSLDVTLDRTGHVWILECNAKPARFDEADIRRRQLQRVVEFARNVARRRERPNS